MKFKSFLQTTLIAFVLFSMLTGSVLAGFGITPPYVKNKSLTRNSTYQQKIFLVRSDPVNDLLVDVFIDVPGINDWFTIEQGEQFLMPRGEVKVPMTVSVLVPDDAEFTNYRGAIRVRTSNADGSRSGSGAVSIALGAQIDVDLTIIDKEIYDFRIRRVGLSDLNAGRKVGWLYFPGKIQFEMLLENTGNIDVAPTRVEFDIYDITGTRLLEQTENSNKITTVKPFGTEEVLAEIPTRMSPGSYIARYRIYNLDEVKQEGEVNLSIVPYGTVAAAGYGFMGLSLAHQASVLVPAIIFLLLVFFVVKKTSNRGRRKKIAK
jgi:hypothetical protein